MDGYIERIYNSPIEITKFVLCGLYFFVHVVEYTIIVTKTFIVVVKQLHYHPLMNAIKIG
jgi:hypothetical protein